MASSTSKSEPRLGDPKEDQEAKRSEKKRFPSQTRYIAFLVLAVVVVMSLAMGIIWAVVKPKRPYVFVKNGYFINSSISHDNTVLSGWLHFEIIFYNPNKKATIYYDTLSASSSFSDKTKRLGSLNERLVQPPHWSIPLSYNFTAEFWSIYGYMPKYQKQGHIILDILFYAKIRFGFANWKSQPRNIHIYCSNLVVFQSVVFQSNVGEITSYPTFKPTVCKVDY